ncbi:glycosyltransferase [Latilactobacillus curvatus]
MGSDNIKVLHVGVDNIGHGGRSTIAYNLVINMDKKKINSDFLAFKAIDNKYKKQLENHNGKVIFIEQHHKNSLLRKISTATSVIKVMKNNRYDVIHIHSDTAIESLKTIILAKIARVNGICIHAHTTGSEKKINSFKKCITILCQKLISNSKYLKLACTDKAAEYMYGKYSNDVNIINNGIDIEKYVYNSQMREKMRENLGITGNFVIGCVARLTKVKNHKFLLEVFNLVLAKNSDAKLLLVGDGPLLQKIKEYATKLKIENNVILLGNRDDVPNIMQAMDVFVLPSLFEGLGLVNIEAQAAGLPCVVSSGVPESAKILESFTFLPINGSGCKLWVDKILSFINFKRIDTSVEIRKANYDIKSSSSRVQSLYCDLVGR